MKQLVKDALFSAGFHAGRHTRMEDLCALLRSLQPQDCGRNLVRVGGDADGGYLLPDDFGGIEYCFSPGVSTIADFENQLADRGVHCFMADYSVEAPPLMRKEFTFDRKFLGPADSGEFITLESWKRQYLPDYKGEMILQMDIEGYEYEVLLSTPESLLSQFRMIVIEFHRLELLFEPYAFRMYRMCFEKLLRHFQVAHIHPNNWDKVTRYGAIEIPHMMEFTFYSRSQANVSGAAVRFPHPLDRDNVPDKPHVALPRCWHQKH